MKQLRIVAFFAMMVLAGAQKISAQNPENWTSKDLMQPADLAEKIKSDKDIPVIFSVGPGAVIPTSKDIGMVKEKENLETFKQALSSLPKDTQIVVYCGCCPFEHCPNVRPAIDALKQMKFTNYKLLNLSHNVKTDWIDKGYPVVKQ
jgi:rhodanese-related sulfurtransferase